MKGPSTALHFAVLQLLVVVTGSTAVAEGQLDLRADVGYDSNVFDLNESVGEQDGMRTHFDLEAGLERKAASGWTTGVDAGAAATLYESSVSDGDEAKYFVRLRGDSGGKRHEHDLDWAVRYRLKDSTYVSRYTGEIATDDLGNEIGDRYDSSIGDVRLTWELPGGDVGRLAVGGAISSKDYGEDYQELGLDRLDYEQFEIEPEYRLGTGDNRGSIGVDLGLRRYRDRRASDVSGNAVDGTDLEYRFYGVAARYERRLTTTNALSFSGDYGVRQDNEVGYDDRTIWSTGVEWTYRPAAQTRLSVDCVYSSRVFDQRTGGDTTINDDSPEKKGYRLNVSYSMPMPGFASSGFSMLAEAGWESYDNSTDVRMSYDRLTAFAGIRKGF